MTATPTASRTGATAPLDVAPAPAAAPKRSARVWSPEIQALRALAVLLVLGYHLFPGRLTGGYIGVDVFFVISGYLITGHIVRDLDRKRFRLRDFYVRRAKRLLPASMLVLLVTAVAVPLLLPRTEWVPTAQQLLASAAYVQNWVLAFTDVDYLSPTVVPTAAQHFWSLSVEEQFYFVWPVLLAGAAWFTRNRGPLARRRVLAVVMALLAAVSFQHAVRIAGDESGYFWSTARMWEFALGGLLSLFLAAPIAGWSRGRSVVSWLGLATIVGCAVFYTGATPFPGWPALVPVAGALAFIAAGTVVSEWSPAYLVEFGPTQLIGDISYSLYLWHWPLIILTPAALGADRLSTPEKFGVLLLSLLLAWLTTTLVENRLRAPRASTPGPAEAPAGRRFGRAAVVVVSLTAALAVVAGGTWWRVDSAVADARATADQAISAGTACFGAATAVAGWSGCPPPFGDTVVPDPVDAVNLIRDQEVRRRCFAELRERELLTCTFNADATGRHVVLFGDSHALHWFQGLHEVALREGWRLTTVLRGSCTPNVQRMVRKTRAEESRCHSWATRAIATIDADKSVDTVVTSALNNKRWREEGGLDQYASGVSGYVRTWDALADNGKRRIVVLADTPAPHPDVVECVVESGDGEGCSRSRAAATRPQDLWQDRPDPLVAAAGLSRSAAVHLLDLTDAFCDATVCPAVAGNVLVYADDNHMTPTWSRTLAPMLRERLTDVLKNAPRAATRAAKPAGPGTQAARPPTRQPARPAAQQPAQAPVRTP